MQGLRHHLNALRILAFSLALVPALSSVPSHAAAGSAFVDSCSAPLPPQLAFTGRGPNSSAFTLHGPAGTLTITRFGPHGLADELRLIGYRVLPGDSVGEFTLITSGRRHIYGGPVHLFRHARGQHVCRAGAIAVDAAGNSTQQANPYRIKLRIDGRLSGGHGKATVWVRGARFTFVGSRTS